MAQSTQLFPRTKVGSSDYVVCFPIFDFDDDGKVLTGSQRYEFYYDVILHGKYTFKISRLHKEYGPIIRIGPNELHVETPDFYEKLYAGNKRDKSPWYVRGWGIPDSTFATIPADLHRIRRSAMSPFFSKASVRALQPLIQERAEKLLERMLGFRDSDTVIQVEHMFSALTNGLWTIHTTYQD